MSSVKSKKSSRDIRCVVFPDEVGHSSVNPAAGLTALATGGSAARAWERCGESFVDLPKVKDLNSSGRTLSAVRKLNPASFSVHDSSGHHNDDPVNIAWTSSENEGSSNESPAQVLAKAVPPRRQERKRKIQRPAARAPHVLPADEAPHVFSHHDDDLLDIAWTSSSESDQSDTDHDQSLARAMAPRPPERRRKTLRPTAAMERSSKLPADEEDLPLIDSDSDLNGSPDQLKRDSAGHISECESPPQAVDKDLNAAKSPGPLGDPDASDWTAGGGGADSASLSGVDGHVRASRRSLGDWVRAAQAMHMHTPRKQPDAQSKTPQDSGKKSRKLTSGGFAERLTRLQSRRRSSFSLWRHLSVTESSDSTATAVRPGVLVLEVLDVREECSMQLVRCEQRRPPGGETFAAAAAARLLVLFDRETSAQLRPAPRDVIHVYPPWQRLDVEDEGTTVILNTHLSQKVYSDSENTNPQAQPRPLPPRARCVPYSLSNTFGLHGVDAVKRKDATAEQVASGEGVAGGAGDMDWAPGHSLLEVIEALGQPGSVGPEVRVVVQRVYSSYVADRPAVSAVRPRAPPPPPVAPPRRRGRSRLCALVQDGHGMFSVVQLQALSSDVELQRYTQRWQGRACSLRNIKVVQRVTRERYGRAFHLIDSVWPPTIPFQGRGAGGAPCFYYLLSGQEDSVEALGGPALSPLYLPPKELTLRAVLQSAVAAPCHSFTATVVYAGIQGDPVDQAEVWLSLTDPSLQEGEDPAEGAVPCRRTVPLCISASCVLTSSVTAAIRSPAPALLSFRDVVMESGALLCTEQSVVQTPPPDRAGRSELTGSQPTPAGGDDPLGWGGSLPRPVRLDPLGPDTPVHSLCALTGVIVSVEEGTACSWPACSSCGSDRLQAAGVGESRSALHCRACDRPVPRPSVRLQLEVTLASALSDGTVKVRLHQNTIQSILPPAALQASEFPGYEVEHVLGKALGPIPVVVRVISRAPALCIGVEEISLWGGGGGGGW